VAATVLLRPIPPVSEDRTVAGRAGEYFTIARLLPLFQEGAPEYVPALNSQLAALANDTPESFKNGQESMLQLGLQSKGSEEDTVDKILAQVANAQSNSERDILYVKAIRLGAQKSDQRIRRIADDVNDEKLRDSARSFADLVIVSNAISKKRVDEATSILHEGRLTALHRVWTAAKIVGFLDPSDGVRALQLLDEGVRVAESMGQNDVQRSYAFACLAAAFLRFDRYRSWSLTEDAVKTANLVPNFTPDGGKLSLRLRTRNIIAMVNSDEPSFNLTNLFVLLSKEDLNLALSAASRLKGEGPTASVNLAIARSILERSPRGVSARK